MMTNCRWCGYEIVSLRCLHGDECGICYQLHKVVGRWPEITQQMLDSLNEEKAIAILEERLQKVWSELETELRCPHCGTLFDPEEDYLGTSALLKITAYVCSHCNKVSDFPRGEGNQKEESNEYLDTKTTRGD